MAELNTTIITTEKEDSSSIKGLLPVDTATILQAGGELAFMKITPLEAPFVVGIKGRNISLIRKCSGMILSIKGDTISMTKQRPSSKPSLAVRMVLSACCGGILKWFVTQAATQDGYPPDKSKAYEALARSHRCTLRLLRARCGHMCLMLVPDMPATPLLLLDAEQLALSRAHITAARVALLEALPPGVHTPLRVASK